MSMRAVPGQNPQLSVAEDADLANIPTGYLLNGDWAYSDESGYYRLDLTSMATSSATAIPTLESEDGSLPGRFLFTGIGPSGVASPFSREFFVDGGTSVPAGQQNGSAVTPFATIAQAINRVKTFGVGSPVTIDITAGVYDEQLDLSALANMNLPNITFRGAGQDATIVRSSTGTTLVWVADSVVVGNMTFSDMSILADAGESISIDGAAAGDNFMNDGGLVFRNVRSDVVRKINNCYELRIEDGCEFTTASSESTRPEFKNNGTLVLANSVITCPTNGAYDLTWNPDDPIPTGVVSPNWVMRGMSFRVFDGSVSGEMYINGCPVLTSDRATRFGHPLLLRPTVDTNGNQMNLTMPIQSYNDATGSFAIDAVWNADLGIVPVLDFSHSAISNAYLEGTATGEAGVASVKFCNAIISSVEMTGAVSVDMRNASTDQSQIIRDDNTPTAIFDQNYELAAVSASPYTVTFPIPFPAISDYSPNLVATNDAAATAMAAGWSMQCNSDSIVITFKGGAPTNASFILSLKSGLGAFFSG